MHTILVTAPLETQDIFDNLCLDGAELLGKTVFAYQKMQSQIRGSYMNEWSWNFLS